MITRLLPRLLRMHQDGGGSAPCTANIIDESTANWDVNDNATNGNYFLVSRIFYLSDYGKAIFYGRRTVAGDKDFHQIILVDMATWTIDKTYVYQNEGWSTLFDGDNPHFWKNSCYAAGKYVALVWQNTTDPRAPHVLVIDIDADTSLEYHFDTEQGVTQNVNYTWEIGEAVLVQQYTPWIDVRNNRLYLMRHGTNVNNTKWELIYTDLTATPSLGYYTFTQHAVRPTPNNAGDSSTSFVNFFPDENRFIVANKQVTSSSNRGHIWINRLDTGALVKQYNSVDWSDMWFWGVDSSSVIYNNKVYAPIGYSTNQSQGDRRGLMIIDLDTDAFSYERPTYNNSLNDYSFIDAQLINNFNRSGSTNDTILLASSLADPNGGVALYDLKTGKWEYWNSNNVTCFLYKDQVTTVGYDSDRGLIICASSIYDFGAAGSEKVKYF